MVRKIGPLTPTLAAQRGSPSHQCHLLVAKIIVGRMLVVKYQFVGKENIV